MKVNSMQGKGSHGLFSWCLSSYASHIHTYLKRKELKSQKLYFRSPQLKYRPQLINWIRSVAVTLRLSTVTVHLGVRLIDLFMDNHNISEKRLAAICLTCLVIAAKYEEEDSKIPKLKDLPALVHKEASIAEFRSFEVLVLGGLQWKVAQVTPAHFAEYYSLFAVVNGDPTPHRHLQDLVQSSMRDFLDLSLTEVYLHEFMSSKVAATCLLAARLEHGLVPAWPRAISSVTGYSLTSLQPCLDILMEAKCRLWSVEEESRYESGYESASPDNAYKKRILSHS